MQQAPAFSLRIVSLDYYMGVPIPGLDVCFSSLEGTAVDKVPVVRIFGATPAGQKCCLHLHRVGTAPDRVRAAVALGCHCPCSCCCSCCMWPGAKSWARLSMRTAEQRHDDALSHHRRHSPTSTCHTMTTCRQTRPKVRGWQLGKLKCAQHIPDPNGPWHD
jgi:hypothetical protein